MNLVDKSSSVRRHKDGNEGLRVSFHYLLKALSVEAEVRLEQEVTGSHDEVTRTILRYDPVKSFGHLIAFKLGRPVPCSFDQGVIPSCFAAGEKIEARITIADKNI